MASIMPPIPRFFFLYGEPFLLFFGGFLNPILDPTSITTLLPPHLAGRNTTDPNPTPLEHLLGLQSAVLMFMLAFVTYSVMRYCTNPKVIHLYVIISAVTDIPHWGAFFYVLGWEGISQWRTWHAPLWMQLGVPVLTMALKLGYLSGMFGEDRDPAEEKKRA
ncbi:hypothetical protein F5884DRAFT_778319 [Xylogone sp. PMI_703]|nr:hypothetical protein F5884DRAFT_778319 [Xylogone sp. PMI_703]